MHHNIPERKKVRVHLLQRKQLIKCFYSERTMSAVCLTVLLFVSALCELSLPPLLPPAVSLSGLSVVIWALSWGKSGVVGIFYGHHQWGKTFSCSNMTGSQAARRHRSLVSNLWKERSHLTAGRDLFFFFLNRKLLLEKL